MVGERFMTGEGEGGVLSSSLVGGSAFRTWGRVLGLLWVVLTWLVLKVGIEKSAVVVRATVSGLANGGLRILHIVVA